MASSSGLKAEEAATVGGGEGSIDNNNQQLFIHRGLKKAKKERGCTAKERISKMPPCVAGKRSSIYRGVTRHRWTGRYEAHLWDKSTWNQNQNKKGKQVYLGAYDDEEAAARAYDLAALKYWGPGTLINFPVSDYLRDLEEMQNISREDYLASLRRKSSGFSRGLSKYRGLSRPAQSSPWETSFGRKGVPAYLSSIYGTCEGTSKESEYPGGFCVERKIDLTNYIKWWGSNRIRRTDSLIKSLEGTTRGGTDNISCELKALEWGAQQTEPYKMPCLGLSRGGKKHRGLTVSALSILSRSGAYKSLNKKVLKEQNNKDQNESKNNNGRGCGKSIQKASCDGASETCGVTLSMNWLPYQRTSCPSIPFLPAPPLTSSNTMDPLADPIFWRSLGPVPPTGPALITEVTKTEPNSTYPCFHPEER